jgi:hypothetical protein
LSEPDPARDQGIGGIGLDGLPPVAVWSNCTSVEHRIFCPGTRGLAR